MCSTWNLNPVNETMAPRAACNHRNGIIISLNTWACFLKSIHQWHGSMPWLFSNGCETKYRCHSNTITHLNKSSISYHISCHQDDTVQGRSRHRLMPHWNMRIDPCINVIDVIVINIITGCVVKFYVNVIYLCIFCIIYNERAHECNKH